MPDRRTLVTGGAGFLGSHLCDRLMTDGHSVVCVDNFLTGQRRNVERWIDHGRFELLRHDVTLPLQVDVDEIYNLACPASPIHYQYDPIQTTKTSVLGAIHIGDGARIGSGSVVIRNVPSGGTVVGVPGRIVPQKGDRNAHFDATLDHASLPDPVSEMLRSLRNENTKLRDRLTRIEKALGVPPQEDDDDQNLVNGELATTDLPPQHGG